MRTIVFAAAALAAALPLSAAGYRITGPRTHENLAVYLIHGPNVNHHSLLTLQEALDQKKVIVYETRNVNELAIENISTTDEVYVQSGDIVKGGQQDRTLKDDLIIPIQSGRIRISSFCVEHGRWTKRGNEAVTRFESAPQAVATREVKKAMRLSADQSAVWSTVASAQARLANNLGGAVSQAASPSSFMLTLESSRLRKPVEDYVHAFSDADSGSDVVGYAIAVNGTLSSADIYGSHELFRKLWPKALQAAAVEAIADFRPGVASTPPSIAAVSAALLEADSGNRKTTDLSTQTRIISKESEKSVVFETRDRSREEGWIHRSYLVK